MKTKFNNFLNESVSRIQYNIGIDELESGEREIQNKAESLNLSISISRTPGTTMTTLLMKVEGEDDSIAEFKDWLKNDF
jgi:hypothetical protein